MAANSWAESVEDKLDLALVTKEYERLYNFLKQEQEKATRLKKDLVIITGEIHNMANSSMLQEFMVTNICARLGIKQLVVEVQDKDLEPISASAKDVEAKSEQPDYLAKLDMAVLKSQIELGPELNFPADSIDLDSVAHDGFGGATNGWLLPLRFEYTACNALHGLKGPKHTAYQVREDDMVKTINTVNSPKLCLIGRDHMPALVEQISKNKKNHVIGLNLQSTMPIDYSQVADPAEKEFLIKRQAAAQKFYTPKIPPYPQIQPAVANAMVLLVSHNHMVEKGKMTAERRDLLQKAITQMVPDIPGLSAGIGR